MTTTPITGHCAPKGGVFHALQQALKEALQIDLPDTGSPMTDEQRLADTIARHALHQWFAELMEMDGLHSERSTLERSETWNQMGNAVRTAWFRSLGDENHILVHTLDAAPIAARIADCSDHVQNGNLSSEDQHHYRCEIALQAVTILEHLARFHSEVDAPPGHPPFDPRNQAKALIERLLSPVPAHAGGLAA